MPKFDKRFVYFIWADELKDKICFVADSINELEKAVERNDLELLSTVVNQQHGDYPFQVYNGIEFRFCYYDPNYSIKIAHEQGKKIECKIKGDAWEDWDYTPSPAWLDDHEYRIMPEEQKPVTNRELAFWLVRGYGQIYHYDDSGFRTEVKTSHGYHQEEDNCDCNINSNFHCKIRKWGDTEWVTPSREYMGLDE